MRQSRTAGWLALALVGLSAMAGCRALPAGAATAGLLPLAERGGLLDLSNGLVTPMKNHSDSNGPMYTGEFAGDRPEASGELLVVSYNLRYGEAIDEMIEAFGRDEPLPAADIVLLQEMDEAGVETIARELGYDYAYFPASVAEDGDNFGNAILARWPMSEPVKLILPGLHPITGQQRTATRAVVRVEETDVLVYSTHIEVASAPPSHRAAQFAAILGDVPADAPFVIVGGDFNTVTGRGVDALVGQFGEFGFAHDTADLGPTLERFGLRPSAADHIFSRGFERKDAGVLDGITASDHFPVWVRMARPQDAAP